MATLVLEEAVLEPWSPQTLEPIIGQWGVGMSWGWRPDTGSRGLWASSNPEMGLSPWCSANGGRMYEMWEPQTAALDCRLSPNHPFNEGLSPKVQHF